MSKSKPRFPNLPEIDLARLPRLPLPELHDLWHLHFRTSKPPPKRRLLVRELAYHVQSQRVGGLDTDTRKRLDTAVRKAMQMVGQRIGPSGPAPHPFLGGASGANEPEAPSPPTARARAVARATAPTLPAAATLVRVWNGRRHEVTVVEGGRAFVYRGTTYRSLTAVSRVITGTEWSGPRFFGLAARPGKEAT